jgi:hypothetical protein
MARLTIPDEETSRTFTVTTSTSVFPIGFVLPSGKDDLLVTVGGNTLLASAYSFTGTLLEGGGYDGGTVTLNTAVENTTVVIERRVPIQRTTNFAPANSVPVGAIDLALNRLTAISQDLERRVESGGGSGGGGGAVTSVAGRTGAVTLTKTDVGLSNVDNTSDAAKPVSTATATALAGKANTSHTHAISDVTGLQTALDGKIATAARGAVNGVAALGADGLVPSSQLPVSGSYLGVWNASTNSPTITSGASTNGDFYIVGTAGTTTIDGISSWAVGDQIRNNGTVWQKIATNAAVSSVAGKTGAVTLVKADVGLSNVDNTSDANKPVSTATATALAGKANTSHTHVAADVTNFSEAVDDRVATLIVAGTGITKTYDDAAGTLTIDATPGTDPHSIRPEDYGALGDGTTNDATALQNAINAAISQGKPLRPSRNYFCNSTLTASGGSLSICGDGIQGAEIIFAANHGLVFNGGTPTEYNYATLLMKDLALRVTGGVSTASVLKVTATNNAGSGSTAVGFIAENLDISGQAGTDGFLWGIELVNARNVAITNVRILGDRDAGFSIASTGGIRVFSDGAEATELNVVNSDIYFVNTAIEMDGTFEGAVISDSTIVACYTGIYSYRTDGGGDPLLVVSNCHINTYRWGVRARNRFQSFISGCLFYAFDTSTAGSYFAVDLISEVGPTLNWQIVGNTFKGAEEAVKTNKTGIRINGGATLPAAGGDKTSTIEANHFERLAQGITLGNYSSYVTVGPTNTRTDVDAWVSDGGAANRIHYPLLRQPGTQTTIMLGSGAEDATNALVGVNLVPDANSTHLNGTTGLRWAHTYTDAITVTGTATAALIFGESASTSDSTIVVAGNGGGGGNFQVRASGTNPIFMRVGGNLRRVLTTNMGGFDVLVLE